MSKVISTAVWYSGVTEENKLRYDHSRAVYKGAKQVVEIVCREHGSFWQQAYVHQKGSGCPKCSTLLNGESQRQTRDGFILLANKAHSYLYDYSLVVYKNSTTKVDIVCSLHGVFSMLPLNHLRGQKCPACAQEARTDGQRTTQQDFLHKCSKLKKENLSFEQAYYVDDKTKVNVTCKVHGIYSVVPSNLLQGQGCPKCMKCGYNVGKPGHLYILVSGSITKVGITNRKPSVRVKEVNKSSGKDFSIHTSIYCVDGSVARNIELATHKYLASKYQPVAETFDGSTECFLNVDLDALINFVTPLALPESV